MGRFDKCTCHYGFNWENGPCDYCESTWCEDCEHDTEDGCPEDCYCDCNDNEEGTDDADSGNP